MNWSDENRLLVIAALADLYSEAPPPEGYRMLMRQIHLIASKSSRFLKANEKAFWDAINHAGLDTPHRA